MEIDVLSDEPPMLFFRGQFGIEAQPVAPAPALWGWGDRWG